MQLYQRLNALVMEKVGTRRDKQRLTYADFK